MQDEEHVERPLQNRIRAILPNPDPEEHVQEVGRVGQLVLRIDVGKSAVMSIAEGRERRHLGHQPDDLRPTGFLVVDRLCIRVEGGQSRHGRDHHPHRVGIVAEAAEKLCDVLVDIRMKGNVFHEPIQLVLGRELPSED